MFIIFFTFSNIGFVSGAPQISSPQVSVTANTKVSLRCLVEVRPGNCWDNQLQWYFNNSLTSLKHVHEKYNIQERKTNTRCKTDFIITIFNVTEADEGEYKCKWVCDKDYPSFSRSSTIQLKVYPPLGAGMNNCVIFSSAFSKGARVGEFFLLQRRGGKKNKF